LALVFVDSFLVLSHGSFTPSKPNLAGGYKLDLKQGPPSRKLHEGGGGANIYVSWPRVARPFFHIALAVIINKWATVLSLWCA
jgi:hypothetical protein